MDLQTISMDRNVARRAVVRYRRAMQDARSERARAEDEAILRGYRAIAHGQTIISLRDAIRSGGEFSTFLPKLAIARADEPADHGPPAPRWKPRLRPQYLHVLEDAQGPRARDPPATGRNAPAACVDRQSGNGIERDRADHPTRAPAECVAGPLLGPLRGGVGPGRSARSCPPERPRRRPVRRPGDMGPHRARAHSPGHDEGGDRVKVTDMKPTQLGATQEA